MSTISYDLLHDLGHQRVDSELSIAKRLGMIEEGVPGNYWSLNHKIFVPKDSAKCIGWDALYTSVVSFFPAQWKLRLYTVTRIYEAEEIKKSTYSDPHGRRPREAWTLHETLPFFVADLIDGNPVGFAYGDFGREKFDPEYGKTKKWCFVSNFVDARPEQPYHENVRFDRYSETFEKAEVSQEMIESFMSEHQHFILPIRFIDSFTGEIKW